MIDLTKIARPYAKAAFEFAGEHNTFSQWSEILNKLSIIVRDPKITQLLKNPQCTSQQLLNLLMELMGRSLDVFQKNFVTLLAEHRKLIVLPEIAKLFEKYRAITEKTIEVKVCSVIPLSPEYEKILVKILNERLGRKVKLHCHIDPSLIGGLSIRAGDKVIDCSVRGQLNRLREQLIM